MVDAAVPLVVGSGSFSEAVVDPRARLVDIVVPVPSSVVVCADAADSALDSEALKAERAELALAAAALWKLL